MAGKERDLTPRDEAHERLMRSILEGVSDTPLVLKAAHDGHDPRSKVRDLYDLDFLACRWPVAFTGDLASRLQVFAEDPGVLESRYKADYDEDDLIPDLVALEDLALRMHYDAREVAASRAEIDHRIGGLSLRRGAPGLVAQTFCRYADEAVEKIKAGGASAYEVDWRQVEEKSIRECLEYGQSLDSIAEILDINSPGAASPSMQAALRERIAEIEAEMLNGNLLGEFSRSVSGCRMRRG